MVLVASGLAFFVEVVDVLCSVSMDVLSDTDLVGVDILHFPVEFEVSEANAPSLSAILLPNFGCQGIDISVSVQYILERNSGRDVPGSQRLRNVNQRLRYIINFEGLVFFS